MESLVEPAPSTPRSYQFDLGFLYIILSLFPKQFTGGIPISVNLAATVARCVRARNLSGVSQLGCVLASCFKSFCWLRGGFAFPPCLHRHACLNPPAGTRYLVAFVHVAEQEGAPKAFGFRSRGRFLQNTPRLSSRFPWESYLGRNPLDSLAKRLLGSESWRLETEGLAGRDHHGPCLLDGLFIRRVPCRGYQDSA